LPLFSVYFRPISAIFGLFSANFHLFCPYFRTIFGLFSFSYPGGGESYLDLIDRLKPLIIEIERRSGPACDMLIVCHQAVGGCGMGGGSGTAAVMSLERAAPGEHFGAKNVVIGVLLGEI
jgi:broad specificity phosphatase PhoE